MKPAINKILLIFVAFIGLNAYSQQTPLEDLYMLDRTHLNPAFTGTTIRMPVILTSRQQWAQQFEYAPSTQAISLHKRIRNSKIKFTNRGFLNQGSNSAGNVGIGGSIFNHRSGAMARTGIRFNYAYHIELNNAELSFGLGASMTNYHVMIGGLTLPNEGAVIDPAIEKAKETTWIPDAHFGVFLYNESFFMGFSANQLFNSSILLGNKEAFDSESDDYDFDRIRQYNTEIGYKFKLGYDWEIEPSLLFKTTEKGNSRFDINSRVIYQQNYWLGVSYRTQKAFMAIIGLKFENMVFAYCYEQELADIRTFVVSSHQIMVGLRIGEKRLGRSWR
ncbi:PorP/SprF family type IX secretion system membrane protein [Bacteroidota bacterium]